MTDNFTLTSAAGDDHISRALSKTQCWDTQAKLIERSDLERFITSGDEAFVKYLCHTTNGKSFRTPNISGSEVGKVEALECYFGGAGYPSAASKGCDAVLTSLSGMGQVIDGKGRRAFQDLRAHRGQCTTRLNGVLHGHGLFHLLQSSSKSSARLQKNNHHALTLERIRKEVGNVTGTQVWTRAGAVQNRGRGKSAMEIFDNGIPVFRSGQ